MKILCVFASIVLAVSGYRIARNPNSEQPKLVECGGYYGYFDVVYPSITGPRTIITSSNFGEGDYANNEKCSVQFVTEDQPINLRLNFTDFDLEEAYSCFCDSVCVNGVEYSGSTLDGTVLSYYVPENSSFTFSFKSDGYISERGFRVVVDATSVERNETDNYEDRCLTQYDEPSPTPIMDQYFPENTDYPDYEYVNDEFSKVKIHYITYSSADSDYGNNYNEYSTGDYDSGNNYNDYRTSDYDNSNNYNDYTTSDSTDVEYIYDSQYDYEYRNEDNTEGFTSETESVYEEEHPLPG